MSAPASEPVVVDEEPVGGPDDCAECQGAQIIAHFEWKPAGRRWVAITCWSCRGSGEAGAA